MAAEALADHVMNMMDDSLTPRGAFRRRLLAALPIVWLSSLRADDITRVIHQGPESPGDTRNNYYWQLLSATLEATREQWGPYELINGSMMNGPRAVHELQSGELNVIARSTGLALEQTLLPIRIPLDKGLLGYRVFLIRRELQAKLDDVHSLDELKRFSIGQDASWNDVPILRAAGFQVVGGGDYEGLFAMLAADRFDLFSRSVVEAVMEMQARQARYPMLTIERSLLLYYPLPRYLFVRKDAGGEKLAARISQGFEILLKNGGFDRLFKAYCEPIETTLNLKSRRLFRIPNPTLSPETPLGRTELWYDPTR
jgi:hypothetical protein